jgi:serine/threonine-protein kinase
MPTGEDARLGEVVENYRLISVLGSGSTSVVYRAKDIDDEQAMAAVKVLTFHDAAASIDRAAFRTRFLREARAASRLRHDHILPVLSYGEMDELTYMVMPLITGGTLGARLTGGQPPLPLAQVADYARQLAGALDYAHSQGIVHRDVKPSNVLLDERGPLYLTDFGIARLFDTGTNAITSERIGLTHTGQVLGTPYYMAPEQIKGEPVGPATDIYALGVVVYQMVTGQVPYQGDTPLAVAMQHLQDDPCPPSLLRSGLPPAAEEAILRAMAKQPADRFATAAELADALERAVREARPANWQDSSNDTRPVSSALLPGGAAGVASSGLAGSSHHDDPFRALVGTTLGSYRLDELVGVTDVGGVFRARSMADGTPYRLRVLATAANQPAESRSIVLGRVQQLAHTVAGLQHPYILPLLDYGSARGMPYLVFPNVAGLSLAQRLAQTGPMELLAAGRTLDRIAAALEYAHEHGILHRNLTADCIFVHSATELAVADFEVRRMVELGTPPAGTSSLYYDTDAVAPEQLLGRPVDTYTDVYALGVVLYTMLTGRPIYSGATRDDIAQQHLYAAVAPLRRWRAGLPPALENILARALAKEPEQRFRHPAELSNAYRQIVGSASGSYTFAPSPLATPGPAGSAAPGASPAELQGAPSTPTTPPAPAAAQSQPALVTPRAEVSTVGANARPQTPSTPIAPALAPPGDSGSTAPQSETAASQQSGESPAREANPAQRPPTVTAPVAPFRLGGLGRGTERGKWTGWLIGIGTGIVLAAILVGVLLSCNPSGSFAQMSFSTGGGDVGFRANETLNLNASNLPDPPQGKRYAAWFENVTDPNSEPANIVRLGVLTRDPSGVQGSWKIAFNGNAGTNLLLLGNTVLIYSEDANTQAPLKPAPNDKVVLQGSFPAASLVHLQHLLARFTDPPTPEDAGLLVAMRHQVFILQGQALALKESAFRGDRFKTACYAQSVLDIIEGKPGQHFAPLSSACVNNATDQVGDGYGFLGQNGGGNYTYDPYIAAVEDHMNLALKALGNATSLPLLNEHAGHVFDAMEHVRALLTAADQDAVKLLQNPGMGNAGDVAGELSDKCDAAVQWQHPEGAQLDATQFGVVDAYVHAQFAATLRLSPP